ncbi:MAG: ArnT family glycosyltransferase [Terriglobales bacterium]|nr:glycosyltransferase family 39 protein [Terriglobales bacterium]
MTTTGRMDDDPSRKSFGFSSLIAGLLLLLMGVLAGGAVLRESVTVDEVAHIGAGLSYVQKLDLRMNEEHPPLAKVLAVIPLVIRGTHADYSNTSWTFGERKFFGAYLCQWVFGAWVLNHWNDPVSTVAWARFPMLLLTLALGWSVFVIARRLGGYWGGLLCLVVYVSYPAFLAFGPLVHTDIPVTLFSLLALWTFAEIWREPDRKKSFLFGLCLAGAILSKFTAGILFFAFGIFAFTTRWWPVAGQPSNKAEQRLWRRLRWRFTLGGIAWASGIVYVFYFIFSIRQTTDILDFVGHGRPAFVPLRRLLMPVWLFLRGLFMVLITASRPTFILGHTYPHGVWFYYPAVFVLKSPLGFLGLLLLALAIGIALFRKRGAGQSIVTNTNEAPVHWRVLWVSLIVFTAVDLLSRLDISIRHFTVPVILIILLLAPLPAMLKELRPAASGFARLGIALAVILAGSCLFTAVRTYPYYFPYVNSLSFGRPIYTLMNDSNVDWNQSIPEVKRFAEQRGLQKIALDWYGLTDSTKDVPGAYEWNCQQPAARDGGQWAVVSANLILDSRNCPWLLMYPHESLAGGSMLAVHLPQTIPSAGSSGGPPLPSQYHPFFGFPLFDIRTMFLNLVQHPDKIPEVYARLEQRFKQQAEEQKKHGKDQPPH